MNFQLLIKTKILKIKSPVAFKLSDVVFIMLINVKMPTIVSILTFKSMIFSCSVEFSIKSFIARSNIHSICRTNCRNIKAQYGIVTLWTLLSYLPYHFYLKIHKVVVSMFNSLNSNQGLSVKVLHYRITLCRTRCSLGQDLTPRQPVLSGHSKINKTKILKTNGSFMKVKSIAESDGAFCNTFDLH